MPMRGHGKVQNSIDYAPISTEFDPRLVLFFIKEEWLSASGGKGTSASPSGFFSFFPVEHPKKPLWQLG